MSRYYEKEIIRGFTGIGIYKLKENIKKPDVTNFKIPCDVVHPDEIIDRIKNIFPKTTSTENSGDTIDANTILAKQALLENRVHLVPQEAVFVVRGSKGDIWNVSLFPTPKCQCPVSVSCYHIRACEFAVGLVKPNSSKFKANRVLKAKSSNLTQWYKEKK